MIDVDSIERAAGEPAADPFGDSTLPLVVAAGRLMPAKGQDDLLSALELLNRTNPVNLLVVSFSIAPILSTCSWWAPVQTASASSA
jgi:hypothetical protein